MRNEKGGSDQGRKTGDPDTLIMIPVLLCAMGEEGSHSGKLKISSDCDVGVCAQSCLTLQPHELEPARLLCPWDFPGKNTGVGSHFLLQGIFLTQTETEPVSPEWAGRFSTTASPGRPNDSHTHTLILLLFPGPPSPHPLKRGS